MVSRAFLLATGSEPTATQTNALVKLLGESAGFYKSHPEEAAQFFNSGIPALAGERALEDLKDQKNAPAGEGKPDPRAAALMVVCRALFSSEEFLRTW